MKERVTETSTLLIFINLKLYNTCILLLKPGGENLQKSKKIRRDSGVDDGMGTSSSLSGEPKVQRSKLSKYHKSLPVWLTRQTLGEGGCIVSHPGLSDTHSHSAGPRTPWGCFLFRAKGSGGWLSRHSFILSEPQLLSL